MAELEIEVPPDVEMRVAQLVEQGEFDTEEQAIEELLSMGLRAYQTGADEHEEEHMEDSMMGHEDEYVF